ncbi:helix-turn-helix domain-containing protein [Clostridium fallax]|uniref:Transcriptional regulator, AraC family n=1 Tax=Clostridium fallax TaxID=1533 RepID=A0A1M4Y949_9CLOT|nr:helix-turn-helix domain-containing protein [Clostridium fallax]SHF02265.1 transcriptional regulator, AraC family [Clostridium fallax]SQB06032.1 transcriptional regulator [Clostridium fallax]
MRKEYINYPLNVPVNIFLTNIKNYPIHWHNAIEIIYVLKGTINVTIDSDIFKLKERELEIINVNESHSLMSDDCDNKVLIFYIDPYFFEKYYTDIENMFFYTAETGQQESEEYDDLRTYLSIILCEAVQKPDNYDEEIENTLVDLLYLLINDFNYLTYEKEELKENEEQLERYHRISKFIYNNYNNNITLKDIANKEFLSTHYLSHEIKYATGYSFTDLINITRIEESVKLLLDSDKTISEISEEIGFSHTRYFNKHFKSLYKCTPLQFRKKYKVDDETLEKQKQIKLYPLEESLEYLLYYLEDYNRFNYDDRINKIDIKVDNNLGSFEKIFKEVINVGDSFDLLIEDNKDILEELQYEIGFEYARLFNLFSRDMGIFPEAKFYNWNRAFGVLEFLEDLNLKPLIVLNDSGFDKNNYLQILTSFLDYFMNLELLNFNNFKFQFSNNFTESFRNEVKNLIEEHYNLIVIDEYFHASEDMNLIFDTAYMLPFIIHNEANKNNNLSYLKAFDVLDKQENPTNEVFFGYPGLVNDRGIKKPSYYAYYLINKLGDTLIEKDKGYIVTKKDSEYQILLYNDNDDFEKLIEFNKFNKLRAIKATPSKRFSLNIIGIPNSTRMITYEISEKIGSSYNYWVNMGRPVRLNKEEKEILHKASFPNITFKFTKKSTVLNIQSKLNGYGAVLIIIKEVPKHLK